MGLWGRKSPEGSVGGGRRFGAVAGAMVKGSRLDGQGGERVELCWIEVDVGGRGVGAELVDGLGADNDRRDSGSGQQPGQRHLVRRQTPPTAEPVDLPGDADLGVAEPCRPEALVA